MVDDVIAKWSRSGLMSGVMPRDAMELWLET